MLHIFKLRMNKTYLEKEICDCQIWLYYVNWQVFLQKHPISILVLSKEKKRPKNEWPWHHLSLPFTMGSEFENDFILIFSWDTFHTFNLHQGLKKPDEIQGLNFFKGFDPIVSFLSNFLQWTCPISEVTSPLTYFLLVYKERSRHHFIIQSQVCL